MGFQFLIEYRNRLVTRVFPTESVVVFAIIWTALITSTWFSGIGWRTGLSNWRKSVLLMTQVAPGPHFTCTLGSTVRIDGERWKVAVMTPLIIIDIKPDLLPSGLVITHILIIIMEVE
jgi:hypothetical protein